MMRISLISNPPYNMKWDIPPFAANQNRFNKCELPPESNANFAFILTALEKVSSKAVFLLPCSVLNGGLKQEQEIRKYLIEKNLIEAVITCPNNMFESTGIATCIIVFNKYKKTQQVEFVDMRNTYDEEEREQRGQYGNKSHTNRVYKKKIVIFNDEQIEKAINAVKNHVTEKGFAISAGLENIKENKYNISPGRYIEIDMEPQQHREYKDIIKDLNHIIEEKNGLKVTMNGSLAKSVGLYDVFESFKQSEEINKTINEMLGFTGEKIIEEKFVAISKKKGEFKFENKHKDKVSTILMSILQMWRQHIMYLNTEENRYLAELRDALIPDLMTGKKDIEQKEEGREEDGKTKTSGKR